MKKVILIDNGHGSNTAGKHSPDRSLMEYKYAREIAERIVKTLTAKGYDAQRIVPEETDISLAERCRRVNKICDKVGTANVICVSVHCNAAGGDGKWKSAGGWCVYTSPGKTKADDLATCIYEAAEKDLAQYINEFPLRKAKGEYDSKQKPMRADWSDGDPDYEARFYILMHTKCPCVLTESLFQDNKADVNFLLSEQGKQAIVNLHVDGIIKYLNK